MRLLFDDIGVLDGFLGVNNRWWDIAAFPDFAEDFREGSAEDEGWVGVMDPGFGVVG